MSARPKSNIRFNGREYANADEMPVDVRAAYDRVVDETAELHSGARLAAKLKATIIVNDAEFNHPGEMSVDHRHLYHEALEAVFPPNVEVSANGATENQTQQSVASRGRLYRAGQACLSLAARLLRLKR